MLCEAVKSYLANAKGIPFFYAVGDENYKQILSELKQNGVIVESRIVAMSFCEPRS